MASDWVTLTVDQIKATSDRAIAIGPFGSRMKADLYVTQGVPVIRGNNLSAARVFTNDFVFVSHETANELLACNVFAGDLVFPHRGAIGEVGIVPEDGASRYMLSTSLMKLTCNRELVDPKFVFYFFRSPAGRAALLQHASTVGTPGIGQPLASLRSIRVPVPPLAEQREIVRIVGSLDDKIDLNKRMSETLEAIAQALYISWFVDFDPVRAKCEGRTTDLPDRIAELFPDSLEYSQHGEIPKGWGLATVGDLATIVGGTTPSTANPLYWNDGQHPWVTPKDLSALSTPVLLSTERSVTDAGLAQIGSGLLPRGTILLSSRAPIGYLAVAEISVAINQGFIGMIPHSGNLQPFLALLGQDRA